MGKGPRKGGGMGRDDFLLWKEFTRDIEPLEMPDWEALEGEMADVVPSAGHAKTRASAFAPEKSAKIPPKPKIEMQAPQLDARTEARLRRGQMPVEGRLDLHGMTQDEAHTRLNGFIIAAHGAGKRCVLVITGKGLSRAQGDERSGGVLRQKLPMWLSIAPLSAIVLKHYPAVQRDGGTGAWYVYLKRQRDY